MIIGTTKSGGDLALIFGTHLRQQLSSCFPELDQAQARVEFVEKWMRPASIFYRYRIGDDQSDERFVLVKVPLKRPGKPSDLDDTASTGGVRPRLVPQTDGDTKFRLEYTALSLIQTHFDQLDEGRFGAIQVYDFLPKYRAIVMEESRDPSLRQLFKEMSRFHRRMKSDDLPKAFSNAGAWLAAYHKIPKPEHVESRHTRQTDFVSLIEQFSTFLGGQLDQEAFFTRVAEATAATAARTLPETLPLGLGHGDYALRNILVGPYGEVTVFDTLAKWQTAIYEDIAYFLVGLKFNRAQVFSQGLAFDNTLLSKHERAFLAGYFGQKAIPYEAVRLYEVKAVLDKWVSVVLAADRKRHSKKRALEKIKLRWNSRFYKRAIKELLQDVTVRGAKSASYSRETLDRQLNP